MLLTAQFFIQFGPEGARGKITYCGMVINGEASAQEDATLPGFFP